MAASTPLDAGNGGCVMSLMSPVTAAANVIPTNGADE